MVQVPPGTRRAIEAVIRACPAISKHSQSILREIKRLRGPRKCWRPITWEEHNKRLSEYEFRRRYRMSRETFAKFCEIVRPSVPARDMGQFRRCTGREEGKGNVDPPSLEVELAFTIRWLAGGQIARDFPFWRCWQRVGPAARRSMCAYGARMGVSNRDPRGPIRDAAGAGRRSGPR